MTIQELFAHVGLDGKFKTTKWNEKFHCNECGVYVVSVSPDPTREIIPADIRFNDSEIQQWIDLLPEFTIDGKRPTLTTLKERLKQFWLPTENILYIGQTGSCLSKRVADYYKTPLGARKPHSGGMWLKTLDNINTLYVYYAHADNAKEAEDNMLTHFKTVVGEIPFANLEAPGYKKPHGLSKQRERKK